MARFFTWVEQEYKEPAEVPDSVRKYLRAAWLAGASVDELAGIFKLPVEWVEYFVREGDTRETPTH